MLWLWLFWVQGNHKFDDDTLPGPNTFLSSLHLPQPTSQAARQQEIYNYNGSDLLAR